MSEGCHDHKSCIEMFQKLSEYLDNELDQMSCEDIEEHAAKCISCKVCLETLKRTISLCRHMEAKAVPESFSSRLKETLKNFEVPRAK